MILSNSGNTAALSNRKTREDYRADYESALLRAYTFDVPSAIRAITTGGYYNP
ncbi:hypothetical protein [Scytonema sp. NUACC26]|uniref:hypothetical protein n=1 Tax=Scytonema sp. NUACC26 TaxID=3140176 RepID=UPI0034DC4817